MMAYKWTSDADGFWFDAGNWSQYLGDGIFRHGVPGAGDSANINTPDFHTITYNGGDDTIASLSVGADAFAVTGGSLTVTGSADFGGGLTESSSATLTFNGRLDVTGSLTTEGTVWLLDLQTTPFETFSRGFVYLGGALTLGGAWSNGGTTVWQNDGTVYDAGVINLGRGWNSGTLINNAGALINLTTDVAQITADVFSDPLVTNAGTIVKNGGTGTSYITTPVVNTGTILAESGTLELDGTTTLGGTVGGGAGAVLLCGTVTPNSDTTGTVTFAAGASFAGAALTGPGTFSSNGTVGIADLGTDGALWLGGGAAWQVDGTVNDAGLVYVGSFDSGTIDIVATCTFNLTTDDGGLTTNDGSGQPSGNDGSLLVNNAGTLAKTGGTGTSLITASIVNTGMIIAASGTLDIAGNVTGTGTLTFDPGTLLLEGTVAATENVVFTGGNETLILGSNADVQAPVSGFSPGDAIALEGQQVTSAVYSSVTQTLAITGSTGKVFDLTIAGTYQPDNFAVTNGEVIFADVICFMPGTRVRTPEGERAVESLAIGDPVLTAEGETKPVLWIGRQTVSRVFADPLRVLPIRITEGALDENQPVRDLLVSPDHALLVDGVLIQAGALVNGTTIRREEDMPEVFTYYHVELADHALLLAEGVPAETFVDNVDRMGFDNWHEHLALHPDGWEITELPLPRAKSHRQVPMATRHRLALRTAERHPAVAAA